MVIAALGTVFAAAYLLWLYQRTAFGTVPQEWQTGHVTPRRRGRRQRRAPRTTIHDVSVTEWIAWTPMLVLILVLGVYPQLLFKIFDPAVTELVAHLGRHLDTP